MNDICDAEKKFTGNFQLDQILEEFDKKLDSDLNTRKSGSTYFKLIFHRIEKLHELYVEKNVPRIRLFALLNETIEAMQRQEEAKFRVENNLPEAAPLTGNMAWLRKKTTLDVFSLNNSASSFNKYFVAACEEKGLDPRKKPKRKRVKNNG